MDDEVEVAVKSLGEGKPRRSPLLDEFERLTVEIQLNQAMLRRSLSGPVGPFVGPAPQLVREPVEQGKRVGSWAGFNKVMKKLIRPMFIRRKKEKRNDHGGDEEGECSNGGVKDLKTWRRFSKSVRL